MEEIKLEQLLGLFKEGFTGEVQIQGRAYLKGTFADLPPWTIYQGHMSIHGTDGTYTLRYRGRARERFRLRDESVVEWRRNKEGELSDHLSTLKIPTDHTVTSKLVIDQISQIKY